MLLRNSRFVPFIPSRAYKSYLYTSGIKMAMGLFGPKIDRMEGGINHGGGSHL
jgi:hypothetical protein